MQVMKKIILFNALIWAAVILLVSYLLKENEASMLVFYVIIIASTLQMSLLNGLIKKEGKNTCRKE